MQLRKINILIGNSFGSEGKGNIAAFLAERYQLDVCISNNGPNAGHQFIHEDGTVHTAKMLPVSGIIAKESTIYLGSGSVIDVTRLEEEIDRYKVHNRLFISPTAAIVDEYCREYEKEHLQYIASTFQGTGAAIGLKAMRSQKIKLAKDVPSLKEYIHRNISGAIMECAAAGKMVLAEVSQGIHLSVDGSFYPYCTSRPINVGQTFAYLDVPVSLVGDVIGVTRSHWIRVGNVPNGQSGGVYPDSKEITWEELSEKIGRPVKEMTTVTKRVRRIFTFSKYGFELGVKRNGINIVFLTFADYLTPDEIDEMVKYLTSNQFNFKEIYIVGGFGEFSKNITQIW